MTKLTLLRRFVQVTVLLAMFAIPFIGEYQNLLAQTGSTETAKNKIEKHWVYRNLHALRGEKMTLDPFPIQGDLLWSFSTKIGPLPGDVHPEGIQRPEDPKAVAQWMEKQEWVKYFKGEELEEQMAGVTGWQKRYEEEAALWPWWHRNMEGDYSISDPLGVVGAAVSSGSLEWKYLKPALLLTILALVLGRVFCGWLCPVGLLMELATLGRKLLNRLGLATLDIQFPRWTKYVVLALCLFYGWYGGVRLSSWIYGPRLLSAEADSLARLNAFTIGIPILLAVFLFEMLFSKRWLCRVVCPGGALYSMLSWARVVRVTRRATSCVGCDQCVPACTMGLEPHLGRIGPECDGCGSCIVPCPTSALAFRWSFPRLRGVKVAALATAGLIGLLVWAGTAEAHHTTGVNQKYSENYPSLSKEVPPVVVGKYSIYIAYLDLPVADKSTGKIMRIWIKVRDKDNVPYDGKLQLTVRGGDLDEMPAFLMKPNVTASNTYNFRTKYFKKTDYDVEVTLLDRPDDPSSVMERTGRNGPISNRSAVFIVPMGETGISRLVIIISGCGVLAVALIQVLIYVRRKSTDAQPES